MKMYLTVSKVTVWVRAAMEDPDLPGQHGDFEMSVLPEGGLFTIPYDVLFELAPAVIEVNEEGVLVGTWEDAVLTKIE